MNIVPAISPVIPGKNTANTEIKFSPRHAGIKFCDIVATETLQLMSSDFRRNVSMPLIPSDWLLRSL